MAYQAKRTSRQQSEEAFLRAYMEAYREGLSFADFVTENGFVYGQAYRRYGALHCREIGLPKLLGHRPPSLWDRHLQSVVNESLEGVKKE